MKKSLVILVAILTLTVVSFGQTPITLEKVDVTAIGHAGDKAVPLISFRFTTAPDTKPLYSLDVIGVYVPSAAAQYFHNVKLWNMESNQIMDLVKYENGYYIFYLHLILDQLTPTRTFTAFADVGTNAESMKFGIYIDSNAIAASSIVYGRPIPVGGNVKVEPFTLYSMKTAAPISINNLAWNLEQNYPNPFNPTTTIKFSVPSREKVSLKVFDALGREVKVLVNEVREAGEYQELFDARDLSSGTYYYLLEAGTFKQNKKMILLK